MLEYVVRSDTQRELLLHEANTLEKAIENSADPIAGVRAYRRISHERLGRKLEQVRQIALRRSGGRGADAKKVLLKTEAEFETSKERLEGEIGASEMGEESQKAAEMLVEVQTSLELVSRPLSFELGSADNNPDGRCCCRDKSEVDSDRTGIL